MPGAAPATKQPLRVLHVINSLTRGGAETVLFRLATYPSDVDHEVVSLGAPEWYSSKLAAAGIPVHHLDCRSGTIGARDLLKLRRLIRASRADVVQTWMYRSNVVAGVAAKLAHKPVVWNIRTASFDRLPRASRWIAYLGGRLARWVPDVVVNCSAHSEELHKSLGYGSAKGAVIPNGYDAAQFSPDEAKRAESRGGLGVDANAFLIGKIARWHPYKGFPILLKALGLARKRGVPFRAVLAGIGLSLENAELIRMIDANGLKGCVDLIGPRSDVPDIARALDLHIMASVTEGFPNVVAETMLCATPNVATDVGDAALIVGDTGWIVPPGDAEAMADAIAAAYREWKTSPGAWQERRRASRDRVHAEFQLERMVRRYEKVWSEVANARHRSRQDYRSKGFSAESGQSPKQV